MEKYSYFTKFWDLLSDKKEAKARADYVLRAVNKYNRNAKNVLEMGVGIGQVLTHFCSKYKVYGLDIEKEYIDIVRKKIPEGIFITSSMHNFRIDQKFDVIFSVYDSINFLKKISQWTATFDCVDKHLHKNGLFIFDMYTPEVLKYFKNRPATAESYSFGYVHDKGIVKNNTLTWDFRILEKLGKNLYEEHIDLFTEYIYPVAKVKSALSKRFTTLETKLMDDGRRILFVCRKKS